MKKIVLAILLMLSPMVFAQDIAGTWNASIDTPQGPSTVIFDFIVSGSSFSGTVSNAFMGRNEISEGTINGNNVSFKIVMESGPAGEMVMNYRGSLNGNTLELVTTFEGATPPGTPAEQAMMAKRVN